MKELASPRTDRGQKRKKGIEGQVRVVGPLLFQAAFN